MRLSLAKWPEVRKAGLAFPEDILYTRINGAISCLIMRSVTVMAENTGFFAARQRLLS